MSRRRRVAELVAAVVTGVVPIVFEQVLHPRAVFIGGACLAWIAYIAFSIRIEPGVHREWGVSREGFVPALRLTSWIGVPVALCFALIAADRGTLRWSGHFLGTLLLYPLWGIVQQFLVQAMGTRNLIGLGVPRGIVAVVAGVLFAVVHWPDGLLMAAGWAMGFVWTTVYLRHGNLVPLGIWHGWLGACFYYWILVRDPWAEFVGA